LPTIIILAGIFVAAVLQERPTFRSAVRTVLLLGGVAGASAILFIGVYFVRHRAAFNALAGTAYPGRRSLNGGGGSLVALLAAPYGRVVASPRISVINGLNSSEFSAGLFLLFPAAFVVIHTARTRLNHRVWYVAATSVITGVLLVCWFALPIPRAIAALVQFDLIPANRMEFGIAICGVYAFGLALVKLQLTPLNRYAAGWMALLFYFFTILIGSQVSINSTPISSGTVFFLPIPLVIGIWLSVGRRTTVGLAVILLFVGWTSLYINPIQHGLDSLLQHPVREAILELRHDNPDAAFLASDLDATNLGAVNASGARMVGGTSLYPNPTAWHVFDEDSSEQYIWNRYASVLITHSDLAASGTMLLIQDDTIQLFLSPCDVRLKAFGVRYVVTERELVEPCVSEVRRLPVSGSSVFIYKVLEP
jgi:hypothetical protein